MLEISNGSPRIELHRVNEHSLGVRGRGDVYIPLTINPMPEPPSGIRNSLNHYTQNSLLWTALHLVGEDRRILISISQRPEQTMGWFAEAFDLAGWADAPAFKAPVDGDDVALFSEARSVCIDYCGENSYERRLLDRGIATNHGQMPQRLRRLMIALIDRAICPITVATATLTEGVNLPFDMIFLPLLKRTIFNVATERQEDYPMSAAEFRNLSGRAGRPGAAKGMEGLTLIALPIAHSTTARRQIATQKRQVRDRRQDYDDLQTKLRADGVGGGEATSPLSVLLNAIKEQVMRLPGISDNDDFLEWIAATTPSDISDDAGKAKTSESARLADRLDELDALILAAIEETAMIADAGTTPAGAEAMLAQLWQRTFTAVAQANEGWMEQAFVKRGRGMVETIYPDPEERKRLYDYGYSPHVGRRFETIAMAMLLLLRETAGYGTMQPEERLRVLIALGEMVADDGGYGFSVRDTEMGRTLYGNWPAVLRWWMSVPGAIGPEPRDLRAWQIFTSDNFEFRLGVAIGAVVARAWSQGAGGLLATPTIDTWKATTGLPWFAFWAKELLRWGTLDPFVAFALSLGIAKSRPDAEAMRAQYAAWLEDEVMFPDGEDQIDPRNLLNWSRTLRVQEARAPKRAPIAASLAGTDGRAGRYAVIPVRSGNRIRWLDAAGFRLAISETPEGFPRLPRQSDDYDLVIEGRNVSVARQS